MFNVRASKPAEFVPLTERIPAAYFAAEGIYFLKFGGFARTLRFRGGDADNMPQYELDAVMQSLHDILRHCRGKLTFLAEGQRVPADPYPGNELSDDERRDQWPDPVSFLIDEERRDQYENGVPCLESKRYLTLVWRCSDAKTQKAKSIFFSGGRRSGSAAFKEMEDFKQATDEIQQSLAGLFVECEWLNDDETFNYLHTTVSHYRHKIKPSTKARIDYEIADCRVVGGKQPILGDCHMRTISIRNIPSTAPCMLSDLDGLPFEHRYTVRWMGLAYDDGVRKVERQLRDWNMFGVSIISMIISHYFPENKQKESHSANAMKEDAVNALYAIRGDEMAVGYVNINVVVWDKDFDELERKVDQITTIIRAYQMTAIQHSVASLDTWLGTIPGHIYADLRRPVRTSVNLAHVFPYSSVWSGEKYNEHLSDLVGQTVGPLIIARTNGATPFFLSLHTMGDLSHTGIFGPSGKGKTAIVNAIIAAYQKVPRAKSIIFTIKGGGEILTRMLDGTSYDIGRIGPGEIGFQPLAHADEPNERAELLSFVLSFLVDQKVAITSEVREEVRKGLEMIGGNLPHRRTMTHLTSYLTTPAIKNALMHYTLRGGVYGSILDEEKDHLSLSRVMCFDVTELLKKPEIAKHVLAHLFRYIERRVFTGDPVLLVIDEAWRFLGDVLFAAKFDEWLRAARSKNVTVLFATQNMKDSFDDQIGKVLADKENVPNIILLPNKRASDPEGSIAYTKLGFNERDIEIVTKAEAKRQYYFTCPNGRRLFDLKLPPLARAVCASTYEEQVKAAKKLAASHPGDFREAFLESVGLHDHAAFIRHERGANVVPMAAE